MKNFAEISIHSLVNVTGGQSAPGSLVGPIKDKNGKITNRPPAPILVPGPDGKLVPFIPET